MKKITYILLSGIIYLFASCVEDNTQTVFKELNEVTIEGIEDEYENVYINRTLSIHRRHHRAHSRRTYRKVQGVRPHHRHIL